MKTARNRTSMGVAALAAGALLLATPALAQRGAARSRGDSGSTTRTESRTETRTDSRSQNRSEPRVQSRTPARNAPAQPTQPRVQPTQPRTQPTQPRVQPTQNRTTNPAPTGWRSGNTSQPTAARANTTNRDGRFSPGAVSPSAPRGGVNDRITTTPTVPTPNARPGAVNRPQAPARPNTPATPTRPGGIFDRSGSNNRQGGDVGDGTRVPPTRPGSVNAPSGNDNPGRTPSRGSVTPSRPGASVPPVASWRTPAAGASRPDRPGAITGTPRGNTPGSVNRPPQPGAMPRGARVISTSPTNRPPAVDRSRWTDRTRHFGGRNWDVVPLGYYDPWACYRTTSPWFVNVAFYYPYYHIGPYHAGFYYSPFYVYSGWFPTYIYPERVVYIERRVYLRDIVSSDDHYDPYDMSQTSLTSSMEDIRAAWLYGEGGRLLQHINAAVPVRVYQKGVYKYSLEPEDYRDVTKDALARVDTVDFQWEKVDRIRTDEAVLTARHTFRDPDGERHVIRLTYTVEKARGSWWITETGTSAWNGDI